MSEVRVNNLSNENSTGGPTISGITTFSSPYLFTPPQGDTASRPQSCPSGSLRFNTDTAKLEYFRGNTIGWVEVEAELTLPLGGGTGSNTGLGVRALYGGGGTPTRINTVDFVTIASMGDSQDFGDFPDTNSTTPGTCSNRTRGLFGGGYPYTDRICFFTFASKSDSTDFGNLSQSRSNLNGLGDGIRGIFVGGYTGSNQTTMDYISIASNGTNAVDFGDLSANSNSPLIANSSTRGLIGGVGEANVIDFITIATTGNAADFGDLTVARSGGAVGPLCNATRGIFVAGYSGGDLNVLDFVTIATTGNATDFGDMAIIGASQTGAASSPTRGVIMGGIGGSPRSQTNVSQKIEILTTGNSVDFGDITTARNAGGGISNGHGGL